MRRNLYAAALLGSTVLVPVCLAQAPQTQQAAQPTQQQTACDQLIVHMQQRGLSGVPVSLEQARQYQLQDNQQACSDVLQQIRTAQGQPQTQQTPQQQTGQPVQQPMVQQQPAQQQPAQQPADRQRPSQTMTDRAVPHVTVHQPQPQVSVRQPTPEITIRQPAPTITIHQAQPTITVRMPEPQVDVSMSQPQVSVLPTQGQTDPVQPRVTVVPPGEIQATVQGSGGQPVVRFEQVGEPRIVYQRADGQPQIQVEQQAGDRRTQGQQPQGQQQVQQQAARQQQQPAARPQQTQQDTAALGAGRPIAVSRLLDMSLYNERGQQLGHVEQVILGRDNKQYIVIGHGGFLGLGEKRIVLGLDNVRLTGDRLVIRGLTEAELKAMPAWNWPRGTYRELEDDATVDLF
jgi:sporulation protein YlmC with PRC-barrel domain